jgi:hypothetical protein
VHDQVVRVDDPGPFLYELREYVRSLSASVVDRARRRFIRGRHRIVEFARPSIPS